MYVNIFAYIFYFRRNSLEASHRVYTGKSDVDYALQFSYNKKILCDMEIKFEAHYRYGYMGDESDFWEGSVEAESLESAEVKIKQQKRNVFKIIWK